MCCDDYDVGTLAVQKTVKARKPHKCCECGKEIPKGAEYEHYKMLCDGRFGEFHTCLTRVALRKKMLEASGCGCWLFGGLHEEARYYDLEEIAA